MKDLLLTVLENRSLAPSVYKMRLSGYDGGIIPGQFIDIALPGFYLRRPISVCDCESNVITIIYKTVGEGTEAMSRLSRGQMLSALLPLGNGYDTGKCASRALLIGGGLGVPPLYYLAKKLISEGKSVSCIIGFNKKEEIILSDALSALGAEVIVTTVDGSFGKKGFVTDAMDETAYDCFFACGPEPMLKAVCSASKTQGQLSFEARMGCGFGACMGCSVETKNGSKRICRDGPVLEKEEIIW